MCVDAGRIHAASGKTHFPDEKHDRDMSKCERSLLALLGCARFGQSTCAPVLQLLATLQVSSVRYGFNTTAARRRHLVRGCSAEACVSHRHRVSKDITVVKMWTEDDYSNHTQCVFPGGPASKPASRKPRLLRDPRLHSLANPLRNITN